MHGYYSWGMEFGWLFMIIFWALVIIVTVLLVRKFGAGSGRREKDESALDILQKRYAKGELSHEEYLKARDELKHQ